jgi:DNA-binding XRE family transcriptional regulator/predicted RNase H-like HicB family nuclease
MRHTQGHHMHYPAIFEREGKFLTAEFPDCPGCQTCVENGADILLQATDALSGWLEANLCRNLIPPKPSRVRGNGARILSVPVDPLLAIRLELRWARADAELTQDALAKKLGMSQQQLARLESGESNPTVRTIARVAEGLGRRVVMTLQPDQPAKPRATPPPTRRARKRAQASR